MKKIYFISVVFASLTMVSCTKSKSEDETKNISSEASGISSSRSSDIVKKNGTLIDHIDGYKDLKFGMSPAEVAKTEVCEKSYIGRSGINNFDKKISELKNSLDTWTDGSQDFTKKHNQSIKLLNEKLESERSKGGNTFRLEALLKEAVDDFPRKLAEQEKIGLAQKSKIVSDIEKESREYEQAKSYAPEILSKWVGIVSEQRPAEDYYMGCTAKIMGFDRVVKLWFDNEKLSGVTIFIGRLDNDTYSSIQKELAEKYTPEYVPTESQAAAFNNFAINRVAYTYAGNQVALAIDNWPNVRAVRLYYFDKSRASEYAKTITQGIIRSGEL